MKVLVVTGSRRYPNQAQREVLIQALESCDLLLVGDANGVDFFARDWADKAQLPHDVFHAGWKNGRGDGPRRNGRLVLAALGHRHNLEDVVCLAFPGPASVGTWNCVRQLQAVGFEVSVHE